MRRRSKTSGTGQVSQPRRLQHEDDEGVGDEGNESDEQLRSRVRLRIRQRVIELQAAQARGSEPSAAAQYTVDGVDALHLDVLQTAVKILRRYLDRNGGQEALELSLVHRMLEKQVELQALQRQRASTRYGMEN